MNSFLLLKPGLLKKKSLFEKKDIFFYGYSDNFELGESIKKFEELLIEKTKMEMALYRLKICGEQAKLGVQFVGDYAVSCEGIKVTIPPNQVIPHTHKILKEK